MEDLVKKFIYTGVGFAAFAVDKVKETVDSLVKEDKISEEEGKKIVDEFLQNTETKKDEFESQLKMVVEKVVSSFSFASNNEMEDIKARLEAIEAKQRTAAKKSVGTGNASTK